MANPNPTPPPKKYRWKPGQSGNPKGGHREPAEMKIIRRLTQEQVAEVGALVLNGTIGDLEKLSKDKNTNVLKAVLAGMVVNAMKGNAAAFNSMLDRLIGRVKPALPEPLGGSDVPAEQPHQVIVTIPSNGKEVKQNQEEK